MTRASGTARARLLMLLACMHAALGGDAGQGGIALYDHLYEDGFYVKAHWDVGNQEAFLHDVLIADSGPRGQLFAQNKAAMVLDAGAARGAALHWLEQVQEYRRIEAALGMELSGVAVQSTPWPYLLHQGKLLQGSLSDMPWGNNTFDVVISHEVLEHIAADQVPACLAEMVRVSRGTLVLTISLRLSALDKPVAPHVHATCRSRRWWDDQFASVGCIPDLDILAFFWRDARSMHPQTHSAWQPYTEPWIFAYDCTIPAGIDAGVNTGLDQQKIMSARAHLELMRIIPTMARDTLDHIDQGDEMTLGRHADCYADGWCDLFHPSVYDVSEQDLVMEYGKSRPSGGWLGQRYLELRVSLYGF